MRRPEKAKKIGQERQTEADLLPYQNKNRLIGHLKSADTREKTRRKAQRHPPKTESDGAKTKNALRYNFFRANFPRLMMKVKAIISII